MNYDIEKQMRELEINEEEQKQKKKIATRQKQLLMNLASSPPISSF